MIDLKNILEMWEKDAILPQSKLDEASRVTPMLHSKYLSLLGQTKLMLKRAEFAQKSLLKDKWLYYEGKMPQEDIKERGWPYDPYDGLSIKTKHDKEYYYECDPDIQRSEEKIHYYKTVIETLEEIINNIRWRHSTIKNIIDFRKFESGN